MRHRSSCLLFIKKERKGALGLITHEPFHQGTVRSTRDDDPGEHIPRYRELHIDAVRRDPLIASIAIHHPERDTDPFHGMPDSDPSGGSVEKPVERIGRGSNELLAFFKKGYLAKSFSSRETLIQSASIRVRGGTHMAVSIGNIEGELGGVVDADCDLDFLRSAHHFPHILQVIEREERPGFVPI